MAARSRALLAIAGLLALLAPAAVDAEATDATKSESSGNGLQFATAGVLAQFTVTAKDESGVRRTSGGDEWIVELDGTRSITGSVVDNLDGTYQVSYTATKSGSYEAGVKLAKSGGLTGSYFENVWFFYTPVKVTVDPQINMDWGVGRITPTGANYISVRWCVRVRARALKPVRAAAPPRPPTPVCCCRLTIVWRALLAACAQGRQGQDAVRGDVHLLCDDRRWRAAVGGQRAADRPLGLVLQ
jgi:hypothetical protein